MHIFISFSEYVSSLVTLVQYHTSELSGSDLIVSKREAKNSDCILSYSVE